MTAKTLAESLRTPDFGVNAGDARIAREAAAEIERLARENAELREVLRAVGHAQTHPTEREPADETAAVDYGVEDDACGSDINCPTCGQGHTGQAADELREKLLRTAETTAAPQLCGHDDGSWCNETCREKERAFRAYHGLPEKTTGSGSAGSFQNVQMAHPINCQCHRCAYGRAVKTDEPLCGNCGRDGCPECDPRCHKHKWSAWSPTAKVRYCACGASEKR